MKKIFGISFLIVLLWAAGATYIALDHPKVKGRISKFLNKSNRNIEPDLNSEYLIVKGFLETYYGLTQDDNVAKKTKAVSGYLAPYSNSGLTDRYSRNIKESLKNGATSEVIFKKVLYKENDDTYQAIISVKQKGKTMEELLLKVVLSVSRQTAGPTKILTFDEQLINSIPKEFREKLILTKGESIATVSLPCVSSAVRAVKNNSGIELKVLSDRKTVQFFPKTDAPHSSEFKAVCGKKLFKIRLASNEDVSTFFHAVSKSEGYIERTPEELFFMDIEKSVRKKNK